MSYFRSEIKEVWNKLFIFKLEWKISRMGVTVFAVVVAAAQVDLQLIVKVIKSWEWDFPVVCSWWRDWKINPRQNQGGAIREARLKLRKEYWSKSYWNYWNVLIEKHHLHFIKIKYYERTNMQTFDGYSSFIKPDCRLSSWHERRKLRIFKSRYQNLRQSRPHSPNTLQ